MCQRPKHDTEVAWLGWSELPDRPQRGGHGAWTDLTYPLSESVPRAPIFDPPRFTYFSRLPEQPANITRLETVVHMGTHVDAPVHFCMHGPGIDAIPLQRLMGEGVVIPMDLAPGEAISVDHFASATPTIEPGDIVAIHTGWGQHWETPRWACHPYLSNAATEWLIARQVKLVAVDTMDPELPEAQRSADFRFPVHSALLSRGILIAEQLANLESVSGQRVEFVFAALPIVHSDGAPTGVIARPLS